ncbi:hypothetical protein COBT_003470, partial [Conglomerata obtusa]
MITFKNLDNVDSETILKAFSSFFKSKNVEIKYNIYAQFDSISIKNMYLTECEYFARFICRFKAALWLENDFNEKMKTKKPESESVIYYFKNGNHIILAENFETYYINNILFKILQTAYLHLTDHSNILIICTDKLSFETKPSITTKLIEIYDALNIYCKDIIDVDLIQNEFSYEIEIYKLFGLENGEPYFKIDKKYTVHDILYKIGKWSIDAIYSIQFFKIPNEVLYNKTDIDEYSDTVNCTYCKISLFSLQCIITYKIMRKIEIVSSNKLIAHYLIYYNNMADGKAIFFYHLLCEYTKIEKFYIMKELDDMQSNRIKTIYKNLSWYIKNHNDRIYYSPVIYHINEDSINFSLNKGHQFSIHMPHCYMTKKLVTLFHAGKAMTSKIKVFKTFEFQLFSLEHAEFFDFVPFWTKDYDWLDSRKDQFLKITSSKISHNLLYDLIWKLKLDVNGNNYCSYIKVVAEENICL